MSEVIECGLGVTITKFINNDYHKTIDYKIENSEAQK